MRRIPSIAKTQFITASQLNLYNPMWRHFALLQFVDIVSGNLLIFFVVGFVPVFEVSRFSDDQPVLMLEEDSLKCVACLLLGSLFVYIEAGVGLFQSMLGLRWVPVGLYSLPTAGVGLFQSV